MSAEGCTVAASDNRQNAAAPSHSSTPAAAAAAADTDTDAVADAVGAGANANASAGADAGTSAPAAMTPTAKKRRYSEYMRDVESRFKRLTERVLPSSPYLTTSSNNIDHIHYPLVSNNWCVGNGCVFSRREEHLQYMTFLSYQDWDTSLVAVGGWSDANGNVMKEDEAKPSTTTHSGGGNLDAPVSAVPKTKKKMTWSAYKEKKTVGNKETPLREEARMDEQRPMVVKQEETDNDIDNHTAYVDGHGNGNNKTQPPIEKPIKQESPNVSANKDHKKDVEPPKHQYSLAEESAEEPTKRRTEQPTEDLAIKSSHGSKAVPLNDSDHHKQATPSSPQLMIEKPTYTEFSTPDIPGYASPISNVPSATHPPSTTTTMATDIIDLPPLLSPTLPSPLIRNYPHAKEIFGDKDISSRPSSPEPSLPKQSPLLKKRKLDETKEKNERTPTVARKSMPTNDANGTETGSNASGLHRRGTPIKSVERGDKNKGQSKSTAAGSTDSPKSDAARRRTKLLVGLKYGRAKARIVHRILNGSAAHGAIKTVARATPRSTSPAVVPAKKKPSTQDDEFSRSRGVGKTGRSALSSKAPSSADGHQQSRLSESKTSIRTNEATKRPAGAAAASTSRSHTDSTSAQRANKSGVDTASLASEDSSHSWKQESLKYWQLARDLRHDWKRCPDDEFAVVLGIESLLASTLYCYLQEKLDTSKSQAVTSDIWVDNFLPMWREVKTKTVKHPPLQGLRLLLGAIVNALIHERELEEAIHDEEEQGSSRASKAGAGAGAGSDSENSTDKPDSKGAKRTTKQLSYSLDTYRRARQFWLKGSQLLSETVIKDEFPDGWRRFQSVPREHSREVLEPGSYAWHDVAPLTFVSTPVEAVRFAYAFLTDWAGKYHPKWKGQLDRI